MSPVDRRAAREFWRLPDDEFRRLLTLTRAADQVELKLVIPPELHEATCAAFGVDLDNAPTRRVYYLDTPDLALQRSGVVARIRSNGRKPDDAVIKLRPVEPSTIPARLRRSKDFVIEVDGMPGRYVCSGALKVRLSDGTVEKAAKGDSPARKLFSKQQRELLALHAHGAAVDDLTFYGPIKVRRQKIVPRGVKRTLVFERWALPDGTTILELSSRCKARDALRAAAQTAAMFRAHGVDLTGPQQTKTRISLRRLTRHARTSTSLSHSRRR
jgi:hypothetical protein